MNWRFDYFGIYRNKRERGCGREERSKHYKLGCLYFRENTRESKAA